MRLLISLVALLGCKDKQQLTPCPEGSHRQSDGLCHLDEETDTAITTGCELDTGLFEDPAAVDASLSWSGWGQGFFTTYCRSCHGAAAVDRRGAPPGVDFDTEEQVLDRADRIRVRVLEEGTMPTGGGVTDEDRLLLERYLCRMEAGASDTPSFDPPEQPAQWTLGDLETALSEALADGVPDPWTLQETYLEMFRHGDGGCPGHDDYIDDTHLLGCDALTGWYFSGVSEYIEESGAEEGSDLRWESVTAFGDILFRDPEGHEFEVGGHAIWKRYSDESGATVRYETEHLGSWKWEAHTRWLRDTVSGLYDMTLDREGGDRRISIDGAARIYGRDLSFDDLVLREGDCDWAPRGSIRVRDPAGPWHRIDFGESCSPCGQVVYAGDEALGEICLDLSPIVDHLSSRLGEL